MWVSADQRGSSLKGDEKCAKLQSSLVDATDQTAKARRHQEGVPEGQEVVGLHDVGGDQAVRAGRTTVPALGRGLNGHPSNPGCVRKSAVVGFS